MIPEIHIFLKIVVGSRNGHLLWFRKRLIIPFLSKAISVVQTEIPGSRKIHYES